VGNEVQYKQFFFSIAFLSILLVYHWLQCQTFSIQTRKHQSSPLDAILSFVHLEQIVFHSHIANSDAR
jgi:hypothetical protein